MRSRPSFPRGRPPVGSRQSPDPGGPDVGSRLRLGPGGAGCPTAACGALWSWPPTRMRDARPATRWPLLPAYRSSPGFRASVPRFLSGRRLLPMRVMCWSASMVCWARSSRGAWRRWFAGAALLLTLVFGVFAGSALAFTDVGFGSRGDCGDSHQAAPAVFDSWPPGSGSARPRAIISLTRRLPACRW